MITSNSDLSKQYYTDADLNSLPDNIRQCLFDNPYMGDMFKLQESNPGLALEVELCHKAWLEGAISMYNAVNRLTYK